MPSVGREFVDKSRTAVTAVEALLQDATAKLRERVIVEGNLVTRLLDREQRAAHALAWLATYVEALRQLVAYAERMIEAGQFGEIEDHLVRIGMGEYLAQISGGIPMSQGEIARLVDFALGGAQVTARLGPAVEALIADGNTADARRYSARHDRQLWAR